MNNSNSAFILGVPRSGTTMLSLLINQHPLIYCPPEPWLLLGLDAFGQAPQNHPADSPLIANAIAEFLGEDRNNYLKDLADLIYRQKLHQVGKSLFVDKTPRYYLCADLLEPFLTGGYGIFLVRNPLDVAASYRTSWNIDIPNIIKSRGDVPFLFDYILGFNRFLSLYKKHSLLKINYEDLVKEPDSILRKIFDYLSVGVAPVSLTFEIKDAGEAFRGDKKILDTLTVHANSIDTYKSVFNADEVGLLLGSLGYETFVELGYESAWDDACATFSITQVDDNSAYLRSTAESYVAARKISCQKAENNYYYQQRISSVAEENKELSREMARLISENGELAKNLENFQNMGSAARISGLFEHARKIIKKLVLNTIWRMTVGRQSSTLPSISIVTPVFNGKAHISETIESILRQNYPNLQYIIVDGGSTDGTLDIIRSFQDRIDFQQRISLVISEPDRGMYDALAKGFEKATGDIFCYLNADDLLECGGLKSVGEYFAAHPKAQIIYHEDVVLTEGWKYPNVRQPKNVDTSDLLAGHILFQDGVFWRRRVYEAVGGIRRDLKLAGDFDLWLRMSAKFKFVRRPGHVSCFRIRPGQLSGQLQAYQAEMQESINIFLTTSPIIQRVIWSVNKLVRKFGRQLRLKRDWERLFFPIDFANFPPPAVSVPCGVELHPVSPVDGKFAERLLFSTPDTRFGEQEINYVYLDERNQIAISHPPIEPEKLDALYRKNYSNPPVKVVEPTTQSPYKNFNGRKIFEKLLLLVPVEIIDKVFRNKWGDNTLNELQQVLRASKIDLKKPLRFLDAGCFEGGLLDQIREATNWIGFGLEPNSHAVEVARKKGHSVWQGHAEDAVESMPVGQQFDVIFMGQSIEHMENPLSVLRRLRLLLAPGGVLVMSTPNLNSIEIDHFGPTWAHWHLPYHRYIFSPKGMESIVRQAGLLPIYFRSFSHPYWTMMSIAQNRLGLGGSVSHAVSFDSQSVSLARRYQFWKSMIWNRIGRGDYFFFAAVDGAHE